MPKYIERDSLLKKAKSLQGCLFAVPLILDAIEYAPTVDVVEVVRCKDCEHCIVNENHPDKPLICLMTKMCGTTHPEWYCAAGKKKEGAEG